MLFNVKGTTMAEISITGRSGVAAAVAGETGRLQDKEPGSRWSFSLTVTVRGVSSILCKSAYYCTNHARRQLVCYTKPTQNPRCRTVAYLCLFLVYFKLNSILRPTRKAFIWPG